VREEETASLSFALQTLLADDIAQGISFQELKKSLRLLHVQQIRLGDDSERKAVSADQDVWVLQEIENQGKTLLLDPETGKVFAWDEADTERGWPRLIGRIAAGGVVRRFNPPPDVFLALCGYLRAQRSRMEACLDTFGIECCGEMEAAELASLVVSMQAGEAAPAPVDLTYVRLLMEGELEYRHLVREVDEASPQPPLEPPGKQGARASREAWVLREVLLEGRFLLEDEGSGLLYEDAGGERWPQVVGRWQRRELQLGDSASQLFGLLQLYLNEPKNCNYVQEVFRELDTAGIGILPTRKVLLLVKRLLPEVGVWMVSHKYLRSVEVLLELEDAGGLTCTRVVDLLGTVPCISGARDPMGDEEQQMERELEEVAEFLLENRSQIARLEALLQPPGEAGEGRHTADLGVVMGALREVLGLYRISVRLLQWLLRQLHSHDTRLDGRVPLHAVYQVLRLRRPEVIPHPASTRAGVRPPASVNSPAMPQGPPTLDQLAWELHELAPSAGGSQPSGLWDPHTERVYKHDAPGGVLYTVGTLVNGAIQQVVQPRPVAVFGHVAAVLRNSMQAFCDVFDHLLRESDVAGALGPAEVDRLLRRVRPGASLGERSIFRAAVFAATPPLPRQPAQPLQGRGSAAAAQPARDAYDGDRAQQAVTYFQLVECIQECASQAVCTESTLRDSKGGRPGAGPVPPALRVLRAAVLARHSAVRQAFLAELEAERSEVATPMCSAALPRSAMMRAVEAAAPTGETLGASQRRLFLLYLEALDPGGDGEGRFTFQELQAAAQVVWVQRRPPLGNVAVDGAGRNATQGAAGEASLLGRSSGAAVERLAEVRASGVGGNPGEKALSALARCMERGELPWLFRRFDEGGTGSLTSKQVLALLRHCAPHLEQSSKHAQKLLLLLDSDGDLLVSFSDLAQALRDQRVRELTWGLVVPRAQGTPGSRVLLARLAGTLLELEMSPLRLFRQYDMDGDGKLSAMEISRLLKELVPSLTEAEQKSSIAALDLDGDGLVSFDDFQGALHPAILAVGKPKEGLLSPRVGSAPLTPRSLHRTMSALSPRSRQAFLKAAPPASTTPVKHRGIEYIADDASGCVFPVTADNTPPSPMRDSHLVVGHLVGGQIQLLGEDVLQCLDSHCARHSSDLSRLFERFGAGEPPQLDARALHELLKHVIPNMSPQQERYLMVMLDLDGDGCVEMEDMAMVRKVYDAAGVRLRLRSTLQVDDVLTKLTGTMLVQRLGPKKLIEMFDANGTGALGEEELAHLLKWLLPGMLYAEMSRLLRKWKAMGFVDFQRHLKQTEHRSVGDGGRPSPEGYSHQPIVGLN
ncbi:hypothetical protein CYMTET_53065, partial [Cymbomonas tetramitiformis]